MGDPISSLIRWLFFAIFCFLLRLYCGVCLSIAGRTLPSPIGQGRNLSSMASQNSRPLIPPHFLQMQLNPSSHHAKSNSLTPNAIIKATLSDSARVNEVRLSCLLLCGHCFLYTIMLALTGQRVRFGNRKREGRISFDFTRLDLRIISFGYKHKEIT